jgi:NAD(P)H-quinone oxidoreductase subunit 4L
MPLTGPQPFLVISAALFCLGVYAVLTRSNAIAILLGIELMLNAANLNLVAFARHTDPALMAGQVFALFVIAVAAAEAAVALAIVVCIYRNMRHINVEEIDLLRW